MGYSARYHATIADRGLPRAGDRDPDRRRVRRRRADQHPQEPRAQPRRQPPGRPLQRRPAERRTGPLERVRRPRLPGPGPRPAGRQADRDRRPRRAAGRRHRRGRGRARADRGEAGRGRGGARAGRRQRRSPATSRRPASPTSPAQPRHADRASASAVGRQLVRGGTLLGSRPRPPLLARQRQLRRPRRGDRRPQPAPGHGAGAARHRRPARIGADERDHRDADAGGRGRDLDHGTVLDLLLPGQRPLQRRRRRPDRRPAGAGLRDARRRGQLRGQGQRRPPAARTC